MELTMADIPRYAIVLTHNRPELLAQCVAAIRAQADVVLVIDNASDPPVPPAKHYGVTVMNIPDQPPNLSRLWNTGLDWVETWVSTNIPATPEWDVAVLCDDVTVPNGWFETVATGMRAYGAAAASTHQWSEVHAPILKQAPDNDLNNRMCGWAFVVAGEKNLRADEDLRWWWCDTDMDWQARNNGGMVIVPGPVAKNIHPNDFTYRVPGLAEQTGVDGLNFARKWGSRPW
jgi:glycosyltransferase involved in cell wall biosynthesis